VRLCGFMQVGRDIQVVLKLSVVTLPIDLENPF